MLKQKETKIRWTDEEYHLLYKELIKSKVTSIRNGRPTPNMSKFIKLKLIGNV